MPNNQDQFSASNAKICVTYPINANVTIIVSDSQHVVLKAMINWWYIYQKSYSRKNLNQKCTFHFK